MEIKTSLLSMGGTAMSSPPSVESEEFRKAIAGAQDLAPPGPEPPPPAAEQTRQEEAAIEQKAKSKKPDSLPAGEIETSATRNVSPDWGPEHVDPEAEEAPSNSAVVGVFPLELVAGAAKQPFFGGVASAPKTTGQEAAFPANDVAPTLQGTAFEGAAVDEAPGGEADIGIVGDVCPASPEPNDVYFAEDICPAATEDVCPAEPGVGAHPIGGGASDPRTDADFGPGHKIVSVKLSSFGTEPNEPAPAQGIGGEPPPVPALKLQGPEKRGEVAAADEAPNSVGSGVEVSIAPDPKADIESKLKQLANESPAAHRAGARYPAEPAKVSGATEGQAGAEIGLGTSESGSSAESAEPLAVAPAVLVAPKSGLQELADSSKSGSSGDVKATQPKLAGPVQEEADPPLESETRGFGGKNPAADRTDPERKASGDPAKVQGGHGVEPISSGTSESEPGASVPAASRSLDVHSGLATASSVSKRVADAPSAQSRGEDSKGQVATERIIGQVADRIELLSAIRPRHGVTVRLEPADLGSILLTVKARGTSVEAEMAASNESVRQALDSNRGHLGSALLAKGIHLQALTIDSQASAFDAASGGLAKHAPQHQGMAPRTLVHDAQPAFRGLPDLATARRLIRNANGIDLWT